MRIFLDIGAHEGSTLQTVLDKKYNFDKIYSFEPVKTNYKYLQRNYVDERLTINEFGLLNETCEHLIYCAGAEGGSVFKNKRQKQKKKYPNSELCKFVKASDWFKDNLSHDDYVFGKINCEGAEIDILNDLLDSGEYDKLDHILIYFDVRKIKGKEYLEKEMIRRLNKLGKTNYLPAGDIRKGGKDFKERREYWLDKYLKK